MNLRISIPPLTRVLLALLLVISITSLSLRRTDPRLDFLSLVPQQLIFYPWTVLTASFAEPNPITLILIAGPCILYGGRYFERAWGSMELGKVVLIVAVASNVAASILYVFLYAITRRSSDAYRVIRSSTALQAAFLVAFKQLVPEHTVQLFNIPQLRIRVKHFPFLYLVAQSVSGLLLGTRAAFTLSWLGFLIAWIYLRFIKKSGDEFGGASTTATGWMRGDPSSLFAFACFFPDVAQPVLSQVTDRIYDLFVQFRVLRPFTSEETSAGNELANARTAGELPSLMNPAGAGGGGGGRGGAGGAGRQREEADRRRRLALEALDQRLAAASNRGKPKTGPSAPAPPLAVNQAASENESRGPEQPQRQNDAGDHGVEDPA